MGAAGINSVILVGNLTKDPELRTTQSGTPLCKMRLAVNERFRSGDEWKDRANYFDITVWGKQGENCAEFLSKGRAIAVDGRLRWREWETDDGGKRQAIEVVADSVQFLGGKDGGGGSSGGGGGGGGSSSGEPSGDDIPF